MAFTQVRVLGGAVARVPSDATAFAHRDKRIMVNVAVLVQSPDELAQHEPWVAGLLAEVTQGDPGAYVGFLADEGEDRIRAAYPEATWDRLRRVKAQYDPDNVFRLNQNIAPA
jgi:FAD/FMN-containing dehydrogenase